MRRCIKVYKTGGFAVELLFRNVPPMVAMVRHSLSISQCFSKIHFAPDHINTKFLSWILLLSWSQVKVFITTMRLIDFLPFLKVVEAAFACTHAQTQKAKEPSVVKNKLHNNPIISKPSFIDQFIGWWWGLWHWATVLLIRTLLACQRTVCSQHTGHCHIHTAGRLMVH